MLGNGLILSLCIIYLSLSDSPSAGDTTHQHRLLYKALHDNFHPVRGGRLRVISRRVFRRYIYGDSDIQQKECLWNGVQCIDGTIETFIFTQTDSRYHRYIEMDWLPSTLQYLHLNKIILHNGWVAERLPRELRYWYSNGMSDSETHRKIDLYKLPAKMKEMHIQDRHVFGDVLIVVLPETMRALRIQSADIQRVLIDPCMLPRGIRAISFEIGGGIARLDGEKPGGKIFKKWAQADTLMCSAFETETNEMRRAYFTRGRSEKP